MTSLTSREILDAFDESLAEAARVARRKQGKKPSKMRPVKSPKHKERLVRGLSKT
jgi:hypothetical protein